MSTTLYPPVPAPSSDQEFLISAGVCVLESQQHTLDFSPQFLSIYGRPTLVYRPWARLWSISCTHILEAITPRYPSHTAVFLKFAAYKDRYLEFCLEVDNYYGWLGRDRDKKRRENGNSRVGEDSEKESAMIIGRAEMEGAWCKLLIGMFDEMRSKRDVMRNFVGMRSLLGEDRILMTIKEVEAEMKEVLRLAVEQRFGKQVEKYWARKWKIYGYRCPELDIKCVTDWSIEAPFQKSLLEPNDINDNDYMETDNEITDETCNPSGENIDSGVSFQSAQSSQTQTIQKYTQKTSQESEQDKSQEVNVKEEEEEEEATLEKSNPVLNTKQNLKWAMHGEDSDTMHGRLAFRD
ncbi:hypothetical protein BCIN_03g05010 [Botrytis cinerea B05.10]|uniref:Uncharacterized protein n=3 Tax=Botryotinia fuckeliana TaxID=40559 RepID=A0A384JCW8_BOTFB|nr:hypothetical protein BCIN_03g05010 [Botrytis cinerea B05.10]ATZ48267.1 hypothetical protein BCIN_03g05010 [Botrytis cinerea B05.10]EMR90744.1 hypothetical protein BcDW1_621 [Botrytis cinerea BcDW1]CCD51628.1 hypothetical protein BofuT4_P019340.1 [Botrytis cinerea T4]